MNPSPAPVGMERRPAEIVLGADSGWIKRPDALGNATVPAVPGATLANPLPKDETP